MDNIARSVVINRTGVKLGSSGVCSESTAVQHLHYGLEDGTEYTFSKFSDGVKLGGFADPYTT